MTVYWCELAWLGNAGDADGADDADDSAGAVRAGVAITVSGDRIATIESGVAAPPPGAVRLEGLTLPGFANAHSHAFHRALRGRTHGDAGSFWTWRERMYELAATLDPDSYRALATATFAEMVRAGFTCVGEFHYLHHDRLGRPYANVNEMGDALIGAAHAAGIRLTLLDTCYLSSGVGGGELSPVQQRFSDGDVGTWGERVDALLGSAAMSGDGTVRVGGAIHSVRAVDPESISTIAEWAATRSVPLHAHVSEQPAENEQCLAAHGRTPTALLADRGALGPRFTAVHATHLTDHDIALYASSGSICCLCPTTERDLADGIGPSGALRDAGVAMCVGTDSHAVIDPFEEIRAVELDERLATLRRGTHRPGDLLLAGTSVGHRSLGWHDAGRLAPGSLADLVTVGLSSSRLAGTDALHAAAAVVYAAASDDVHHVVVGGKVVVSDRMHQRVDLARDLRRSIRQVWA